MTDLGSSVVCETRRIERLADARWTRCCHVGGFAIRPSGTRQNADDYGL
jgi:hypothetical protein